MFRKLYKLYDFLSCLVRWRGAVYVWRPNQDYLYIFNKKLFHIFYDERTKWFMESQERRGEYGMEEIFRIEAGDVTMRFKKIWMGDMNGVKKIILMKLGEKSGEWNKP
jgi:hypothetical protein